jgi:hypothetical protein
LHAVQLSEKRWWASWCCEQLGSEGGEDSCSRVYPIAGIAAWWLVFTRLDVAAIVSSCNAGPAH